VIVDGLCAASQREGCATALGAGCARAIAPLAVNASNAANSSAGRVPPMMGPLTLVNVINSRIPPEMKRK
jgi:hypothetical protein